MVCGEGAVSGDGIVPVIAAHLDDSRVTRVDMTGVFHSINNAGKTTRLLASLPTPGHPSNSPDPSPVCRTYTPAIFAVPHPYLPASLS